MTFTNQDCHTMRQLRPIGPTNRDIKPGTMMLGRIQIGASQYSTKPISVNLSLPVQPIGQDEFDEDHVYGYTVGDLHNNCEK